MSTGKFGYEIRFLSVGTGGKNGDAILMRWGHYDDSGASEDQVVMVVDAGYHDNGKEIVRIVTKEWMATKIDLMVNTHPHDDHITGMSDILDDKSISVDKLILNLPWSRSDVRPLIVDETNYFIDGATDKYKIDDAANLCRKKTPVDVRIGTMLSRAGVEVCVLGPDSAYYAEQFKNIPLQQQLTEASMENFTAKDFEKLTDKGDEDYINNTSIILAIVLKECQGRIILLTGDAGVAAQEHAYAYAKVLGLDFTKISVFQIPHHGGIGNSRMSTVKAVSGSGYAFSNGKRYAVSSVSANPDDAHPNPVLVKVFQAKGWVCGDTTGGWWKWRIGALNK